ncbi:MAG: hypothetical protein NVS9B9_28460 [Ktedonobacteraceae bacterium]
MSQTTTLGKKKAPKTQTVKVKMGHDDALIRLTVINDGVKPTIILAGVQDPNRRSSDAMLLAAALCYVLQDEPMLNRALSRVKKAIKEIEKEAANVHLPR